MVRKEELKLKELFCFMMNIGHQESEFSVQILIILKKSGKVTELWVGEVCSQEKITKAFVGCDKMAEEIKMCNTGCWI